MTNTLKAPNGKTLVKVAQRSTTSVQSTAEKPVTVDRNYIEVAIFDSRLISEGSQFGHASIAFRSDDMVYSRAHKKYMRGRWQDYLRSNRSYREVIGVEMWISPREEDIIRKELEHRVAVSSKYSIFSNSCSSNIADVLELVGIHGYDPRGLPTPSTPAELLAMLRKSNRFIKEYKYTVKPYVEGREAKPPVQATPRKKRSLFGL
ncbi:hypothetical protein ACKI2N_002690 [Cupriavidus sp. 30B13]|uniref:hypothetical protein n=1 Tax=Cupriavidus sp. 30B13 TaxID=3384241 RepID=UPI003B8EF6E1